MVSNENTSMTANMWYIIYACVQCLVGELCKWFADWIKYADAVRMRARMCLLYHKIFCGLRQTFVKYSECHWCSSNERDWECLHPSHRWIVLCSCVILVNLLCWMCLILTLTAGCCKWFEIFILQWFGYLVKKKKKKYTANEWQWIQIVSILIYYCHQNG